ncbi:MAG: aspartate aminotransferase, partial [Candidatus Dadabacteria bacterium]
MNSLYADRIALIDTENAFKVGPLIVGLEKEGHEVIKLNLGEPDFNIPDFIKEE